jgi:hypothetical protein
MRKERLSGAACIADCNLDRPSVELYSTRNLFTTRFL